MRRIGYVLSAVVFLSTFGLALANQISPGTELSIRLQDSLKTDANRAGDQFSAIVLTPSRYEGAVVRGQISSIQKSGKITGQTRMRLKFNRIEFQDGTSAPISRSDIVQVYQSDIENVKKTSEEGAVESGKQSNEAIKRGAIGAAAGAVIGGLAGGKKGAAIGMIVGGAGGAGSVAVTGKKEVRLERGTEMLIRIW